MEEDQGLAKSITMAEINVGALAATYLTNKYPKSDVYNMFWHFAIANTVIMFTVVPYIKDVVGSKEHISRGHASVHQTSKYKMIKEIYYQAAKVIMNNKMVLISIVGRAIANAVRNTASNNLKLSFQ